MALSVLGAVRRPLFWLGCSFLFPIAAFHLLWEWLAFLCVPFVILLICWLSQGSLRRFLPLLALSAALGWGVLFLHQALLMSQLAPLLIPEQPLTVTMTVEEAVQRGAYRRYRGRAILSSLGQQAETEVILTGFSEESRLLGEALQCEAQLTTPVSDVRALMTEPVRLRITRLIPYDRNNAPHPVTAGLLRWRGFLSQRIASFAPGETGAVLAAMLTGDRTRLTPDLLAVFRRSGLSHLLVVSGMHLVILCGMFSLILAPLRDERVNALLLILFCWGFALMTGAGNSVIRAAVMLTLSQIGPLFGRRGDSLTSLAVAGVLMVVLDPAALLSVSFQLSFGAVAGLALLGKPLEQIFCGSNEPSVIRRRVAANLSAGLAAQAGAAPALLGVFGLFPLLGIAANLLVIELIGPLMTLGLLALVCSLLVPALAAPLFSACRGLAHLLIAVARFFADLPFSQIGISARWQMAGLLGLLALSVVLLARRPKHGVIRLALLGWCSVFLTVALTAQLMSRPFASLLLFDGGPAVIAHGAQAVVIGAPADQWEADEMVNALTRLGVRRIDGVFLLDSQRADLPVLRLLDRFDGPRNLVGPDSPAIRRFGDAADLNLCAIPEKVTLFGSANAVWEKECWQISFSDASLLKSTEKCAIIGRYSRGLSLGDEILHCRVRLEETDGSAQ